MTVYYVFQGITYEKERAGGYVWSPQLDKRGGKNAGYLRMTQIKKGDFILHSESGKLKAISYAKSNCYEEQQPQELIDVTKYTEWNNEGYKVDCEYFDFETPVPVINYKNWLKDNYEPNSAFTINGTGKQQYMCYLADSHAIFLLEESIKLQKDSNVLNNLKAALYEITDDKSSEYDSLEKDFINRLIENNTQLQLLKESGLKPQETTISKQTGRIISKRNPQIAVEALDRANYLCEYNNQDKTFKRKNNVPYTEPHHLIPISKYGDFEYSLDIPENIVSLCSHCHNLLHYGRMEDKLLILKKLYNERQNKLKNCGLEISFEQLVSYYK